MKLEQVAINEIKPDKNQPRETFDKKRLIEIAEAYKTTGMINPIEVDEKNIIICGECRWRAGKIAGLKKVPIIRKIGLSKEERLTRQLSENLARQSLTVPEQIKGIKKLMELTKTSKSYEVSKGGRGQKGGSSEIARRLGVSESWIRDLIKIQEAPSIVKKAVDDWQRTKGEKGFSSSKAIEIMHLETRAEQEELAKEIIEEEIQGGHKLVRQLVKEKKQIKELKQKYEEGKKSKNEELQIIRASEIVNTYRSELNKFMREAQKSVYQIKRWKKQNYDWFDSKSRKEMNQIIKHTKQTIYSLLKEVEALEKSLED